MPRPAINCVDDPTGLEIDPSCPRADTQSDADFNRAEIAADMAAMQGDVDGMTLIRVIRKNRSHGRPSSGAG